MFGAETLLNSDTSGATASYSDEERLETMTLETAQPQATAAPTRVALYARVSTIEQPTPYLVIVLNWFDELQRLVPTDR